MAISEQYQTHLSYLAIITPVEGDLPQGDPSCEHEDYEYILEALKKIGSLHQDNIVWSTVAEKSLPLIEHHRKDINLFTAYLLALLQQNQEGSGFLCIALVEAILTHWFDTAYPETTKAKGVKVWNNRLNQIGVRLQKNAEQLLLNERHIPYQEMVGDLLKTISENASLEVADLKSALRYLRDNLAAIQVTEVSLPTLTPQVNARSQAVANPPRVQFVI